MVKTMSEASLDRWTKEELLQRVLDAEASRDRWIERVKVLENRLRIIDRARDGQYDR